MMTRQEIADEFDILYNNISSGAAPNLNGYEVSLFLTRAQGELVRLYYNGSNPRYSSFENDEETRRYLDTLVTSTTVQLRNPVSLSKYYDYTVDKADGVMFVLRENATNASEGCLGGSLVQVIPVKHEDLNRILEDPFKAPNGRKALRYDLSEAGSTQFHIVSGTALSDYRLTYLRKPKPIIVEDLSGYGRTIEGETDVTEPYDIPDALMHKVIARACELAKAAYLGDLNTAFAVDARDL